MKESIESKIYTFLQLFPEGNRGDFVLNKNGSLQWKMDVKNVSDEIKNAYSTLSSTPLSLGVHLYKNKELELENHLKIDITLPVKANIFKDIQHFKSCLIKSNKVFDQVFIFNENIFQASQSEPKPELEIYYKRFNKLKTTLKTFAENSHHYENGMGYMIYIDSSSEKDSSNIKLSTKLQSLREYPQLLDQDINFTALEGFLKNNKSNYSSREKAILRNTVVNFISQLNDDNTYNEDDANKATYDLLTQHKEFDEKFDANLQIYLKDISIDKIKSELTQEQVKLFESINKSLQEVTNRLMLIPGLGALGTLIRFQGKEPNTDIVGLQNNPSMVLFLISLIVTSLVVLISINNQRNTIAVFESMLDISKKSVSKLTGDAINNVNTVLNKTTMFISTTDKTLYYYEWSLLLIPPLFLYFIGNGDFAAMYALVYGILNLIILHFLNKKNSNS